MMNDCVDGNMRDRLPDFVHGTLSAAERAAVAAHVATCADCAAEVELVKAASRAYQVPAIDTARIVRALPGSARRRPSVWMGRTQRIAAGVGIVVIGGLSAVVLRERNRGSAPSSEAPTAAVVPETLASVAPAPVQPRPTAAQIDSPARVAEAPASAQPRRHAMSFGGGLSGLSDDQLDTLLGELDGMDALPSTEPETHLTPILPPADGGHGAR